MRAPTIELMMNYKNQMKVLFQLACRKSSIFF